MRWFLFLLLVVALVPVASAENHTVIVTQADDSSSYFFDPEVLTVNIGDTVEFVWGNGSHNVAQVSDSESKTYGSGFYSGAPEVGGNWVLPAEYTMQDGTLYYVCQPHALMGMSGSIIVGTGTPPLPDIAMEFGDFP